MTEIIKNTSDTLNPALQRFILHWGDLGGQWGVNRSVAQVHALLLVSDRPLHADAIAATLGIARSNVSTSLKELMTWNLVRRAPILGDRRDHFEVQGDVWEMATNIIAMRKAREIDPASVVLAECLEEAKRDPSSSPVAVERLSDLEEMMASLNDWYDQMSALPKSKLLPLIKLGARAADLLQPLLGGKASKEKKNRSV